MGAKVVCFFIEPADSGVESLRRYSSGSTCPSSHGYHNASVDISIINWSIPHHGAGLLPSDELKADPRWPKGCACGYEFQPEDAWQHNVHRHFVDAASGALHLLSSAPPGAMWNADWMHAFGKPMPPDGLWLCVRLPNGVDWLIDGPSRNSDNTLGPGWQRSGAPPKITARPSIFANQGHPNAWHGFLTDGVLEEC